MPPRRPRRVIVEPIRARAIRPPTKADPDRWYWRAEVHEGGQTYTVWTGRATRAEVVQRLQALALDANLRSDPLVNRAETVEDLLRVWIGDVRQRADLAPASKSTYEAAARRLLRRLRHHRVDRLDLQVLETWRDQELREGTAPATVENAQCCLRIAWRWARIRGIVPDRELPAATIRVTPVRSRHTPTREDVERVIQELSGWARRMLILVADTGCRRGEAAGLTWEGVDFERGRIGFVGKTSPRARPRLVPCTSRLRSELERWWSEDGQPAGGTVVGASRGNALHISSVIKEACREAGVTPFTCHGVRRLVADELLRSGVDIATAAALLGHSPQVLLAAYRRASADDLASAVARLEVRWGQVIEGPWTSSGEEP